MSPDLAKKAPEVDVEVNALAPIATFGIAQLGETTIPTVIRAIIDNDREALPWPDAEDGAETAVLERLAAATSTEELFNDGSATGWKELVDVPVEVHGFRLLPSAMDGAITFAVVDVYRLDEGERTVVTTSARGVLVQLLQGVIIGAVPGVFKLTEVGQEAKGRSRPQRLIRLSDLTGTSKAATAA